MINNYSVARKRVPFFMNNHTIMRGPHNTFWSVGKIKAFMHIAAFFLSSTNSAKITGHPRYINWCTKWAAP